MEFVKYLLGAAILLWLAAPAHATCPNYNQAQPNTTATNLSVMTADRVNITGGCINGIDVTNFGLGGGNPPGGSSGDIQTNAGGGAFGAITPGTGIATFLAVPSSANLLSGLTTKTGTGLAVFGTSPSLTTPTIAGATLSGTLAGSPTFSGAPLFTGLSAGTQTKCLGLDSSNNLVYLASACGSGGGGAGTVTAVTLGAGLAKVTGTQNTGSDQITVTGTINLQLFPVAKTVNYSVLAADVGNLLQAGGAGTITFTLPTATASTGVAGSTGQSYYFGDGTLHGYSLTVGGGSIGGNGVTAGATIALSVGSTASCTSDGTNWNCAFGHGIQPVLGGGTGVAALGTGIVTALGVNVGTDGAPVVKAGALGTPSSGVGTNITGIVNNNVLAVTLATGTSVSLTAPREYYICTGTCTVTPPVPAAGYEFCVMNDDNVATVITLAAIGSSARYEATARTSYGAAGTGTFVSGGAAGDKVCLLGRDSTHYLTVSYNGTWVAN